MTVSYACMKPCRLLWLFHIHLGVSGYSVYLSVRTRTLAPTPQKQEHTEPLLSEFLWGFVVCAFQCTAHGIWMLWRTGMHDLDWHVCYWWMYASIQCLYTCIYIYIYIYIYICTYTYIHTCACVCAPRGNALTQQTTQDCDIRLVFLHLDVCVLICKKAHSNIRTSCGRVLTQSKVHTFIWARAYTHGLPHIQCFMNLCKLQAFTRAHKHTVCTWLGFSDMRPSDTPTRARTQPHTNTHTNAHMTHTHTQSVYLTLGLSCPGGLEACEPRHLSCASRPVDSRHMRVHVYLVTVCSTSMWQCISSAVSGSCIVLSRTFLDVFMFVFRIRNSYVLCMCFYVNSQMSYC
jgi:hypothetical protein